MPKVSIIIPIYNKERRVKESIESVLNQSFNDFELIVINDGSTDNSHSIAIEYQKKDARVKYYNQTNQGVSATRNKGIDLARGEYISFLDADDKWHSEFLARMMNAIGNKNICYCGHYYFINEKKRKPKMKFLEGDILDKYIYNMCTPNTNSWLIKKAFLDKYKIRFSYDLNWGEDMVFFSKILVHEKSVNCVKEYLTEYHMSDSNCLSENSIDKVEKDILWMQIIKDYIIKNESEGKRIKRSVEAFDSYRIPAGIIYRINLNVNNVSKNKLHDLIQSLSYYIDRIKVSNGLRSLKLIFYKYRILRFLKNREAN